MSAAGLFEIKTGMDDLVRSFVSAKIRGMKSPDEFGDSSTLAFLFNGKLQGGAVFFLRNGFDIHVAIANVAPHWALKKQLAAIEKFVFDELGCVRMSATAAKRNRKARKFIEACGLKYEGNMRRRFDGKDDLIIYGMLRSERKWSGEDGRSRTNRAERKPAAASA